MRQSTSNGLITLLLALGFAGCVIDAHENGVVTRDEKRFTVSGAPQLNLKTFDGTIEVRSWDQKDVLVEIRRRGRDAQVAADLVVNVTQDGNRIVIDAPSPKNRTGGIHFGSWNSGTVSLIVTTPKNVTLDDHAVDAFCDLRGCPGGRGALE